MIETSFHTPVMLQEAVDSLNCRSGSIILDGTIGGGGHACEILKRTAPDGILIGIDMDDDALRESRRKLKPFGERLFLMQGNFADMKTILSNFNIQAIDGILLDLGVSSHQLETETRGFSFSSDAPLDMRMNQRSSFNAYDLVNTTSERELERIIREYGEEFRARKIVAAISSHRKSAPIRTTRELAQIVVTAMPRPTGRKKIHPATKTFQALRIAVNDELSNLHKSLNDGIDLLRTKGRFSVISFHSLEDRIVKNVFRAWEKGCICPPDFPVCSCNRKKKLKVITKKPVTPGAAEINSNPRARSARLRTAERV
jgi:16S rRNA (cytosine1402-N4)-methyltransferase